MLELLIVAAFRRPQERNFATVLRLGLTGGIASGKSAVAAMLRDLGFPVLSADNTSHQLMLPGKPANLEIVREFGAEVAESDGTINRGKLAGIVFADSAKLAKLNTILHPRVEEVLFRQFDDWQRGCAYKAAFVEAALLVEVGMHKKLDGLVVVWCDPKQQLERLLARGMNELEAKRRLAAQLPVEEKLKQATYRIDCSGSLDETLAQVRELAAKLHKT